MPNFADLASCVSTPETLRDLLKIDLDDFRYRLLQNIDDHVIYQTWRIADVDTQSLILNMVESTTRRHIVSNMRTSEHDEVLRRLEQWQESASLDWHGQIMDRYVMTGTLPAQYTQKGLEKCLNCAHQYGLWEEIITADCWCHA
jgi:hypothetical protein